MGRSIGSIRGQGEPMNVIELSFQRERSSELQAIESFFTPRTPEGKNPRSINYKTSL